VHEERKAGMLSSGSAVDKVLLMIVSEFYDFYDLRAAAGRSLV
jgi:hypothetical protein